MNERPCRLLLTSTPFLMGGLLLAPGCSSAPTSTSGEDVGSTASAVTPSDKTAYDFFLGKGLKNFQAAGIVGNLDQESGVDPTKDQEPSGPGRGIALGGARPMGHR
jgi:hypothetical protein